MADDARNPKGSDSAVKQGGVYGTQNPHLVPDPDAPVKDNQEKQDEAEQIYEGPDVNRPGR
jgi:hypothetical protein